MSLKTRDYNVSLTVKKKQPSTSGLKNRKVRRRDRSTYMQQLLCSLQAEASDP